MLQLVSLVLAALCSFTTGENIYIEGGITPTGTVLNTMVAFRGSGWIDQLNSSLFAEQTILLAYQGGLFHIGGRDSPTNMFNTVEFFDGISWVSKPHMLSQRAGARAVVPTGGLGTLGICVTGGNAYNGALIYLNTAECFDGFVWSWLPNMTAARFQHGIVQTSGQGFCVIGGRTTGPANLASWECYSGGPSWNVQTSSLKLARYGHGTAYFMGGNGGAGQACVAGGFVAVPTPSATATVECTDLSLVWNYVASLSSPRTIGPMVLYFGNACITGGHDGNSSQPILSIECYNYSTNTWSNLGYNLTSPRYNHGIANYDPPTNAPTRSPTRAPTTSQPTNSPTSSSPTTTSPATASPTRSPSTHSPTSSPTTSVPTRNPTTSSPTKAPTPPGCASLAPPDNGKNTCNFTPHMGNCTQICTYGVATGDEFRLCINGVWGGLVCNSESQSTGSTTNNFFSAFPIDSWQGIISIVAICLVFVLCVLMIIYACCRWRRKAANTRDNNNAIAMTVLPPYTEQGDYVFPDSNQSPDPNQGDPFAAEKSHHLTPSHNQITQDSAVAAAEKVRQDQLAAYEQAQQNSRTSRDETKYENGTPGYGGVSRLTVT